MAKRTIEVEVERRLLENLGRLKQEIAAQILSEAVKKGAELVCEDARQRVPRQTGTLARSLMVDEPKVIKDGVEVAIGPSKEGWYAHFVEMGTKHSQAQPFLRPALRAQKDAAERVIADMVRAGIERVVK